MTASAIREMTALPKHVGEQTAGGCGARAAVLATQPKAKHSRKNTPKYSSCSASTVVTTYKRTIWEGSVGFFGDVDLITTIKNTYQRLCLCRPKKSLRCFPVTKATCVNAGQISYGVWTECTYRGSCSCLQQRVCLLDHDHPPSIGSYPGRSLRNHQHRRSRRRASPISSGSPRAFQ